MSDNWIFIVGSITFLMLLGGLIITWYEVRRIEEELETKRGSKGS